MKYPTDDHPPVCAHSERRKISFLTKAEAKRYARSGRWPAHGVRRPSPYKCKRCPYWHLTSQEPS